MNNEVNRRWLLASRPDGAPVAENFRLDEAEIPAPGAGEMLLRVIYLSLDPYMRGRMSDAKSYAAPVPIGMAELRAVRRQRRTQGSAWLRADFHGAWCLGHAGPDGLCGFEEYRHAERG